MHKLSIIIVLLLLITGYLFYQNNKLKSLNNLLINSEGSIKKEELNKEREIDNKSKCQKDGQSFFEIQKEKETLEGGVAYTVFGNQSYAYDQQLNTCLIAWEDSKFFKGLYKADKGYNVHIRHITDIYSNEDVYSWWQRTIIGEETEDKLGNEIEYYQKLQFYGLY